MSACMQCLAQAGDVKHQRLRRAKPSKKLLMNVLRCISLFKMNEEERAYQKKKLFLVCEKKYELVFIFNDIIILVI